MFHISLTLKSCDVGTKEAIVYTVGSLKLTLWWTFSSYLPLQNTQKSQLHQWFETSATRWTLDTLQPQPLAPMTQAPLQASTVSVCLNVWVELAVDARETMPHWTDKEWIPRCCRLNSLSLVQGAILLVENSALSLLDCDDVNVSLFLLLLSCGQKAG